MAILLNALIGAGRSLKNKTKNVIKTQVASLDDN